MLCGRRIDSLCALACATLMLVLVDAASADVPIEERRLGFDGRERAYLVAVPESFEPGNPAIVVLHGGSLSMCRILEPTAAPAAWLDVAERFGLVLLVPNGFNPVDEDGTGDRQSWNDLRPPGDAPISREDDAGFISAMVAREQARLGFDARSVAVTGASNGGMMAYRMVVERPDQFAAAAAFIANLPEADIPDPVEPRPVVIINGDADPLMPWLGGLVGRAGAPVRSAGETVQYWRRVHGILDGEITAASLPDIDPDDGTRVVRFEYLGRDGGQAPVVLYRVAGGGHSMPVFADDPQVPLPPSLGPRCHDFRGVDAAWEFFRSRLPATPPCPADLDGDGELTLFDFLEFQNLFGFGDPRADFDFDGELTLFDFLAFQNAFDIGCL
ncbi:MAG: hypothetical protein HRU13_00015 [Phycisphaerales bacterium]|nr:hypothetical protein [Phycisphaerales bacterium]